MKVDNLTQSQDFVQHLMLRLLKSPSFTVPIIYFLQQHAQVAATDNAKFYNQIVSRANKDEQTTPRSPLTGMALDSLYSSSEEQKNRRKRLLLPRLNP